VQSGGLVVRASQTTSASGPVRSEFSDTQGVAGARTWLHGPKVIDHAEELALGLRALQPGLRGQLALRLGADTFYLRKT
jgi:hypothetical protein